MHTLDSDKLIRYGIAGLVMLGTAMLGLGTHTIALSLVSLVAVVASIYVTDTKDWFHLRQSSANWIALGIVIVSATNTIQAERARQVIEVANLQSYLQYVLLFQRKQPRVYWQLALLSLGQVAIASTLIPDPYFGGLMLAYLAIGVVTFTLLLLDSERARSAPALAVAGALGSGEAGGDAILMARPSAGGGGPREFARGLTEQCLLIGAVSLMTMVVMFFFLPRWDVQSNEVPTSEPLRSVGFSKTVTLGDLGEVVQNPDVVMRIQFFRGLSNRPLQLADEPLLKGSVVTHYESGRWSQPRSSGMVSLLTDSALSVVRQRITIEPMDVSELFCIAPIVSLYPDQRLRIDAVNELAMRQEDYREQRIDFELGTTGIVGNRQRRFVPCNGTMGRPGRVTMLQMPEVADGESDPLAGLRATAERVLGEANVDPSDRVTAAHTLNSFLRLSGQFKYSLEGQARDLNRDPLEDFVTTNRAGHCEYFAGALVMMLRSQGIPARVVLGFKGGEWNPLGMYYQVQQLHAHAWVEVYLNREDIPPETFAADEIDPPSAWLILDPTVGVPADSALSVNRSVWARMRQSLDYGQVLWANYVVGLNSRRQKQGIYEPLTAGFRAAMENLFGADAWNARMRALANSPLGAFWEWYRRHWFSWRGGLVAAGGSLAILGLYLAVHALVESLRRWGVVRGGHKRVEATTLEMYRRLEAALDHIGLRRQPAQTAHEFAVVAGGHLAESIELGRVAHLPKRIVDAFYRVRFGGHALDNSEAVAVEHALVELERALAHAR